MADDDRIDALGFLEQEPMGDLRPRPKVVAGRPGPGYWLSRGAFVSLHLAILAIGLMWAGLLPTPWVVRSATRTIHEATRPAGEAPVAGPRVEAPRAPRAKPEFVEPKPARIPPARPVAKAKVTAPVEVARETPATVEPVAGPVESPSPARPEDVEEADPGIRSRREALKAALEEHRQQLEAAKSGMLEGFDRARTTISQIGPIQAAEQAMALDRLAKEKTGFERDQSMPFSTASMAATAPFLKYIIAYQDRTRPTRQRLVKAYELLAKDLFSSHRTAEAEAVTKAQGEVDRETGRVTGFVAGSFWQGEPFPVGRMKSDVVVPGDMTISIAVDRVLGDKFLGEMRFGNGSVARIQGLFNGSEVFLKTDGMIRDYGQSRNYDAKGVVAGGMLRGRLSGNDVTLANGEVTVVEGVFTARLVLPR